jgi:hypothetical protein
VLPPETPCSRVLLRSMILTGVLLIVLALIVGGGPHALVVRAPSIPFRPTAVGEQVAPSSSQYASSAKNYSFDGEIARHNSPVESATGLFSTQERIGIGVPFPPLTAGVMESLNPGWYLDWRVTLTDTTAGVDYMPMIRLSDDGYVPDRETIAAVAEQRPGAIWLIGNEPDVKWQDNVHPQMYARHYHELYYLLKRADPSCSVAIGGVSQVTPLRLAYLDAVLDAYRVRYGAEMPVDVWNIHVFILREEKGSWGVDIPPGVPDSGGQLFEVQQHDDLDVFKNQVVTFRRWMVERGQQQKPLLISEYGILMPTEYGFPETRVIHFLVDTFDFLLTARNLEIGYAPDDYRLVQRWCWFSLADSVYPTGNLVQWDADQLTPIGAAFAEYTTPSSD